MPQLQSIVEVVEVPEPLKEAVSISVEALMSVARWEMEKEQQIYVNIESRDNFIAQDVDIWLWIPSGGMEPTVQSVMMLQQTKSGRTLRNDRLLSKQQ